MIPELLQKNNQQRVFVCSAVKDEHFLSCMDLLNPTLLKKTPFCFFSHCSVKKWTTREKRKWTLQAAHCKIFANCSSSMIICMSLFAKVHHACSSSGMADELEEVVARFLARIIMGHFLNWTAFKHLPGVPQNYHRSYQALPLRGERVSKFTNIAVACNIHPRAER